MDIRPIMALCAVTMLAATPLSAASMATAGYQVQLQVPVICRLQHRSDIGALGGGAYRLGELTEYCNAPRGYQVLVEYSPGRMRGATINIGDERVILDGSGRAVISHAPGPRLRARQIVAIAGAAGFDTDRLDFDIEVA